MPLTRREMLVSLPLLGVAGRLAAQAASEVPRIEVAELRALLAKGEAVVIDVREGVSFDTGHIEGARSVPLSRMAELAKDLPKDKLIAAYCT
jgi:rhodanese-related sulfurtransferase